MDIAAARAEIDKVLRILGSEYQYPQPIVRYLQTARQHLDGLPASVDGASSEAPVSEPDAERRPRTRAAEREKVDVA